MKFLSDVRKHARGVLASRSSNSPTPVITETVWSALEQAQLSGSRLPFFLILASAGGLVALLHALASAGAGAPLGWSSDLVTVGIVGLLLSAYASLYSASFTLRVASLCAYLPLLGMLLAVPADGLPLNPERVSLFLTYYLVSITLTVRRTAAVLATIVSAGWMAWLLGTYPSPSATLLIVHAVFAAAFGSTLRYYRMRLAKDSLLHRIDLQARVRTDPLTGLHNRHGWNELTPEMLQAADQSGRSLYAIFFDVDRFKSVNDRFGHEVGDAVLRSLSGTLTRHLPPRSLAARLGGEEFVVLLTAASPTDALAFAERVRTQFQTLNADRSITVSAGIAARRGHETLSALMRRADVALYEAKTTGRDRVSWASGDP